VGILMCFAIGMILAGEGFIWCGRIKETSL
jgi:hypothetical protein